MLILTTQFFEVLAANKIVFETNKRLDVINKELTTRQIMNLTVTWRF